MRLIQRFATGLCLSLFVWHAIADDTPAYITPVSVAELVEQGFDGVILDVRTPEEFAQAHIPNALNVPHPLLTNHLATLGKTAEIQHTKSVRPRNTLLERSKAPQGWSMS